MRIEHLGCAGHFICAESCRYRQNTEILGEKKSYRVSTVGDLWLNLKDGKKRTEIGYGGKDWKAYYETMVFEIDAEKPAKGSEGCGCHEVLDWCELDCARYETVTEARAGHQRMVEEYARRAEEAA